jgi:hypothetical protein
MVKIPPPIEQEMINRMYAAYEKADAKPDIYLGRLGSSFIGAECSRQIWLEWRGFFRESFKGRMLRLFGTGHWQEDRIVTDLRNAGFSVWDKQDSGDQFQFVDDTGHFITKMDGVIKGVPCREEQPHALEIKTHNDKSFKELIKKGVRESKPLHYAQVQITMALAKLTRTIYVALNKNDEQFDVIRIKEDKVEQKRLLDRVDTLVAARLRPAGISDDGSSFGCKWCDAKPVCIRQVQPLKNCRTCEMCIPVEDGRWLCDLSKMTLSMTEQKLACEHWEPL